MARYATVTISSLNAGAGEVWRNVDREEFAALWNKFGFGAVPSYGVGGVGNGIINFSYRIYRDEPAAEWPLSSRLFAYKFGKWAKVADEVTAAAKDLRRKGLTGAAGEPLPNLMSAPAVDWINSHVPEFQAIIAGRHFDW